MQINNAKFFEFLWEMQRVRRQEHGPDLLREFRRREEERYLNQVISRAKVENWSV